jgi:uncharacterized surface protein with fasciclin (FAS1) repeats
MSTRFTLHKLVLASAVAAMMAAAAPGAFAQTADTPSTPTTDPNASMPTTSGPMTPPMSGSTASAPMSNNMPMSGDMSNMPTDYKILNNRYFDGTDLEQAKARGLSDNQIATIVKISKKTGMPFGQVAAMVERGETFPQIATDYNLRLGDVYSVDKEKQEISDYMSLAQYEKSLGKNGSMMDMPMSGSSMPTQPATPSMPIPASASTSSATPTLDIVDTAMAAKNLTTLVKALQIAGLVETLKGAGPFTVFAPTDKAFAKLPAGALDALEADPAKLKMVLTYHVIPANIMASDAMAMTSPTSPPTVEGATLQITKGKRGRLKVNDANVVKADIQASNGTIHIIDAVLMPPMDAAPPTDTTTPTPAPMDATPPAAPMTPPAAPATPGQ